MINCTRTCFLLSPDSMTVSLGTCSNQMISIGDQCYKIDIYYI